MVNPKEYSTVGRQGGIVAAALQKIRNTFGQQDGSTDKERSDSLASQQPSILRSFTVMQSDLDKPGHTQQQQRVRLAQRAFLRHSFNRLDFVAVVSFWIAFVMGVLDLQSNKHVNVFRMLSCLRILRLLGITSGTSVGWIHIIKRYSLLMIWIGDSAQSQEGRPVAGPCGISDWFLLAAVRRCRRPEFQIQPSSYLCLGGSGRPSRQFHQQLAVLRRSSEQCDGDSRALPPRGRQAWCPQAQGLPLPSKLVMRPAGQSLQRNR